MKLGDWYKHQGLATDDCVVFNLPAQKPNVAIPVIEVFLK
jgi:hypothetical protein